MTTGGTSARADARLGTSAKLTRHEAAKLRRIERVLDARALGRRVERIAYDLRMVKADVARIITTRRAAGDARALTDKQAVARDDEVRARDTQIVREALAAKRESPAPTPPPPPTPEPPAAAPPIESSPRPAVARPSAFRRYADVARMRELADVYRTMHPNAAAGMRHLADLHEFCRTKYPNLSIPSEGATLESTRRMFPPSVVILSGGGPAAACLAG